MCKLLFCLLLVWFTLKQLVEALSDHTQMEDTEIDQETHKTEKKDQKHSLTQLNTRAQHTDHTHMEDTEVEQETHKTEKKD